MPQAVLNPVNLQSLLPLRPAEAKFAARLAAGKSCRVGNGKLPAPDNRVEFGDAANVVRAEVIRFFAHGGDEENPVRGTLVALRGAWICGEEPLNLAHADIPYALMFSRCHFTVAVNMRHAKCEALYLDGSQLAKGLAADGLKTKGDVNLRDRFSAEGEVRLPNADIGGSLSCEGGKFHNQGGKALSADGLTTKGSVHLRAGLRAGFSADGEVCLLGADIGGDLDCTGGEFPSEFNNPKGYALNADQLTAKGSVHLGASFSAKGEVRLLGADIGKQLACVGGKFHNPNGFALIAENAKIGSLLWRKMKEGEGVVHLAYAKTGVLADDLDSWKPFKVVLDGFAYDQFAGLASPTDAKSRIPWLAKRPAGMPFSPLPYEQAAKVLFGMGYAREARKILLKKERLQTADKRTPWHHKIGRRLWDVLAGYGYRLRYTLGWMALFIYAGTCVFLDADLQHRIVPHQQVVLAHPDYQSAAREGARPTEFVPDRFSGYPEFNQFWFSVDIFVPLFNLHQETHWSPARDERGGFSWVTLWYWIEIVAGWILTSLFLLSVTGVLRPRQSSGERD